MRMKIANNIKSTLPDIENQNAKDFLKLVEEMFRSADKALAETLMVVHTTMKFDGSKRVDKKLKPKAKNFKKKQHGTTSKVANGEKKEHMDNKCKFCRKEGHFQKDCPKCKAWFEKKERLPRLVKNEILPNLDFTHFGLCVECIKGKQTKHSKKGATRSSDLLEIIHTDTCGPFDTPSFTREKYFITFIDDFSRYGKVKIVRSDRGGEYYGKYDKSGQCPGTFAKFLESHDICVKYTMPGTPQQNGVAERRNRTLMEMVRSMISKSSLPRSL
ncbi:retrovirus-related pol polyprotein from transposon TNT 1-94 [Tanacetum coccineum]